MDKKEIERRFDNLEAIATKILHILDGNGEPGLCEKVRKNETYIKWLFLALLIAILGERALALIF